jgi:circadian clock protein KaiB
MTEIVTRLEELLEKPQEGTYVLRLYVTGATTRSARAVENVRKICDEHLKGRYELTVIDLYQQPEEAARQQILAAPTLVKELPAPVRRLIGDLSNADRVLLAMDHVPDPSGT